MTIPSETQRIKIAQLRWIEVAGGAERMLHDTAKYLDRSKFDMRFFFLRCGGPYVNDLRAMGYSVTVIPSRSGYDLMMRFSLLRQLQAFCPHIIHDHCVPPLVRPLLRLVPGARLLGFEHGEIEINRRRGKPWINWLNGMDYRLFVHQVMVNSAANAQLVCSTHHLSPERVKVIHLGIDLNQFRSTAHFTTETEQGLFVIGYVGRIQNYDKGTDYLPRLAHMLVQMGFCEFRIRIVGDGPDLTGIRALAKELKVEKHLEFLGRRNDVSTLMAGMDVLVLPSRTEAFGLVALEALAVGTRVAAFDLSGIREIIEGCPEVRLAPPGNLTALAKAILDLRQQYGKQRGLETQQYVAAHFNAERMVQEIEQCYLDLVKNSESHLWRHV